MMRQAVAPRDEAAALVQQALDLHRNGRLEDAGQLYHRALIGDPANFDALHLMGVLRHQQGCSTDALRFVAAALEKRPGSTDVLTNYGVILDALKRHQEALDLCQAGYESVTSELGEHRHLLHRSVLKYNMAQVYAMLGRLEEALDCYETASALDPFYAEYLAEIGNILQQLDRDAEAIDYYTRAIRYSRHYPEVYLSKAISHARQEQWSDALTCSSISLELNPDQPDLYAARADILTELGQPKLALAEYDRAIAIGHDSIAMRVNRAVLHFNNGTYELALSDMDDVIARDTHDAAHYENRAAIYQAMGRQDLCSREIEMAKRYTEHA